MSEDDLIERAARAAYQAYTLGRSAPFSSDGRSAQTWRRVASAVLSEAAAQPPAPITAEDVAPALSAWFRLTAREQLEWLDNNKLGHGEAAFVADYLNRRGER